MSSFSAISPGTDLPRHARDLLRMHDAVIGGGTPPMRPRDVVARSWTRVLDAGLTPDGTNTRAPLGIDEVERRRRASPLSTVIGELDQVIAAVADASQMLLVVTDADGIILWRAGSSAVRHVADKLGFGEGAEWTESMVGTNAIGTALAEAAPVQLFSAEHFEQTQHPWYCTAAPIHDPRTGELLGIVDVSGPALTLHPTITALVETAVRLAESQLWRHHESRLERLRAASAPLLASIKGPLLIVDEHGWVAHTSGVAVRDRIAAPRSDRALTIPGLGLCLPEQITDGWLVRPSGHETRFRIVLDLTAAPAVEVTGSESSWRSSLTSRHAEILQLLDHSGRTGLTAAALSQAIYGDPDHVVTVRAEVSRLRRALGSVVETKPYRLASSVELTIHRTEH
ncbi:helix-turn-helix domain-containing protein [Antrihabitans cavernicola]|uniref:GAF domain-containing protein n=1 Tax=Antrihabitans cavernicola TaxID=2495913 RepID=A0A5A7S9S0_9NOCA|nr:helix-turn-helix domain-containing protein [Spelaeibacter cavernicola]KAA0022646.1 GAF domain-containing protein [Spelaeibacter cavernicola]